MVRLIAAIAILAASVSVGETEKAQPYAGLREREVKVLSDEQILDLRNGRGMGYALAAELNGYPGPVHVLELADQLALTPDQKIETQKLLDAMKGDAIPLGERLIEEEALLDRQFRDEKATSESIVALTRAIALTQSDLRARHLTYHLATKALLKPDQLDLYQELRGYGSATQGVHGGHGTGHRN